MKYQSKRFTHCPFYGRNIPNQNHAHAIDIPCQSDVNHSQTKWVSEQSEWRNVEQWKV